MRRTVVLDVVGLTPSLLGENTPNLKAFASRGAVRALREVLPAVTCTAHATFTTGRLPASHGAVANGWYFRDLSEIWLWRQSNRLVLDQGACALADVLHLHFSSSRPAGEAE